MSRVQGFAIENMFGYMDQTLPSYKQQPRQPPPIFVLNNEQQHSIDEGGSKPETPIPIFTNNKSDLQEL